MSSILPCTRPLALRAGKICRTTALPVSCRAATACRAGLFARPRSWSTSAKKIFLSLAAAQDACHCAKKHAAYPLKLQFRGIFFCALSNSYPLHKATVPKNPFVFCSLYHLSQLFFLKKIKKLLKKMSGHIARPAKLRYKEAKPTSCIQTSPYICLYCNLKR